MAFSAHTQPATNVSATRVSAETSQTSETRLVDLKLATNRQMGSGNCANPLGRRYERCSGSAGAGAVEVAESAETSPGAASGEGRHQRAPNGGYSGG